jgi:hypothetical protein
MNNQRRQDIPLASLRWGERVEEEPPQAAFPRGTPIARKSWKTEILNEQNSIDTETIV